ncbi:MAG: glyoxalase [Veillonellaceae bacterium]|nr:glyoxalase [Veillonellaceae bacterium]
MLTRRMDLTISTNKLEQSREFYRDYLGFELVFENDNYIEMLAQGSTTMGVSFVTPELSGGEKFTGEGIILSLEAADVDAEFARLKAAGVRICEEIRDKAWGERSFVINDPNGVHVYIYKAIPPTPEYQEIFDKYKK